MSEPPPSNPAEVAAGIIPVSRPLLPTFDKLEPYLREIDKARYYTNYGQMHDRLHLRLAEHFGAAPSQAALASSGTSALIGLILAVTGHANPDKPLCLCPSYTFVATAVAARACGYLPFLIDIDEASWMIDPARLRHHPHLAKAALVFVVAPYGRMPDAAAWQLFQQQTGVPVIIDAAACFDTIDTVALLRSRLPAAISLHATKTFSTAEGGLILCGDDSLTERAATALNFGFHNSRESTGPSINGKISEYHAAIGLAEMDAWQVKRQGFITAARAYRNHAVEHGLGQRITIDTTHANPYALFSARNYEEAKAVQRELNRQQIGYRFWYGKGLHHQPEYRHCPSDPQVITGHLAPCLIGLPFATDMAPAAIARIVTAIASASLEA